ncbi:bifunctional folylpolyglutamate synthase/dihydrofolate synthase [Candidatus Woesearchaeota archaeon CG11_big_fil_rev_8_21_14_0_20_43_8]|nr:MAG: bifunctional folylpolyglutamate synthase/dihydrofolate synthase [Candidatus Woesearchaeota archaeon CG11_big_fil_rev_8_21_14_0_20_43_8]PIO04602.1 MAG: bifunctional folylpolyglutamate synthase/dihydrofolate synthase [Candidatus Woesearchaeota archaeon CG08_land_8_20_14_0_20_43_7]
MDYKDVIEYLYKRGFFSIKLGLDNITKLCEDLGNPQDCYKTIHVGGTNGKGSVTTFIASVLIEQGYKVGVYTSPHLVDFCERIMINKVLIPQIRVTEIMDKMIPFIDKHTYFEIVTAMAFEYFRRAKVDIAIIEVGMGGRLDATNIIKPILSVITNISLEHTNYLGESIKMIAAEKAGIIKECTDVVTGTTGDALEVVLHVALKKSSLVHMPEVLTHEISMKGSFQRRNAEIAVKAIDILKLKGMDISEEAVRRGMKNAYWPGRLDFIEDMLMFDCAHNPDGAKNLIAELKLMGYDDIILVVGIMKDKEIDKMCAEYRKIAGPKIITVPKIERAAQADQIKEYLFNAEIVEDVKEAIFHAKKIAKGRLVVVTGSIFTVGEGFSSLGLEPFNP